jgi:iron(III) transport system permease protein
MLRRPEYSTIALLICTAVAWVAIILAAPAASQRAIINSGILAAGALAIAMPVGTLLAVLLVKLSLPGQRFAAAAMGLLVFLPLYVQLSAWDAAVGKLGWFTLAHGSLARPLLAGMWGAIFVHGVAAIPWVTLFVGIGLLQVDPAQEEAALLVVPPRVVLGRITLPQTLPFIFAAAIWTAVSTTSEMTVTNIYLVNPGEWTYTERFYMRMATGDATQAAIAVLPGFAGLCLIIGAMLALAGQSIPRRGLSFSTRSLTFSAAGWRPVAMISMWLAVTVLLGVPIASLVSKAGFVVVHQGAERIQAWSAAACLHEVASVPRKFNRELLGTAEVASAAAAIALIAGGVLAWRGRRGGWRAAPAILLAVVALTIPGPVVGAALIQILNHDLPPRLPTGDGMAKSWLLLLYDQTPLAPILAQAIRALPISVLLLWHSFATLDRDVLAAAALDGLSPFRVFWRIALPLRWRAIAAAAIAAFAVSAGDLAWAHLVTPPGLDLLSRRVFGLVHSGVEEQVAAISLFNILVYALLALIALRLLRSQYVGR